jgi:starch synthase (maltosyl-transferring)
MRQIEPIGLDIWETWFRFDQLGDWTFHVEAWSDDWHTWTHNAEIKFQAGSDIQLMCDEGAALFRAAIEHAELTHDAAAVAIIDAALERCNPETSVQRLVELTTNPVLGEAMRAHAPRRFHSPTQDYPIRVHRKRAQYGSWYEFFPRSQGAHQDENGKWVSGTFDDCHDLLERVAAMGFDVVYLPPIHPVGSAFKKGPNNTLDAHPDDPGSPWAIGSLDGGHDAVNPALGGIEGFRRFVKKAKELNLEIALDFALQASPDHPWLKDHPEWFTTRLDGTIAYAENPPKKYQDIYPLNFDNDPDGLYSECLRILEFWIDEGVTIFRVDNPHTKPLNFWAWLLDQVNQTHPEVIFLAEAFTRPAMMQSLAMAGFHQSYTYFTWRDNKRELSEYLNELAHETDWVLRPNFFVNTPDINPKFTQSGNPAAFSIRMILAATMSPTWGVYSGFELCEHEVLNPGGEEYLNSEKYQYRPRDWDSQPNLSLLMGTLNRIRREHPALQQLRSAKVHESNNDGVLVFSKTDDDDLVIVACLMYPDQTREAEIYLDLPALGLDHGSVLRVRDELTGQEYTWGEMDFVRLSPQQPAHIFTVLPPAPKRSEQE